DRRPERVHLRRMRRAVQRDPAGRGRRPWRPGSDRRSRDDADRATAGLAQAAGAVLRSRARRDAGRRRYIAQAPSELGWDRGSARRLARGSVGPLFLIRAPGAIRYDRTRPPSTLSVCPVMNAASSLVRKLITPTRSSGTSGRRIAWKVLATWANSSSMLAR